MRAVIVPPGEIWNNFHTHTFRCKHAAGDAPEFAARAAELGMTKLGMSEHAYVKRLGEYPMRMSGGDVADYVHCCREADGRFGNVKVFCGVECDFNPADINFFREYYLDEMGMDYLVGSVHETKNEPEVIDCFSDRHFGARELRIYTDMYVKMIESGLFTFCAHPDLFGRPIEIGEDPAGWDGNAESAAREILEAAEACSAVLEINVSGVWKTKQRDYPLIVYPRWQFWEMASDYDIRVILNTDAHSLKRLDANMEYGMGLIDKYKLRRVELG